MKDVHEMQKIKTDDYLNNKHSVIAGDNQQSKVFKLFLTKFVY